MPVVLRGRWSSPVESRLTKLLEIVIKRLKRLYDRLVCEVVSVFETVKMFLKTKRTIHHEAIKNGHLAIPLEP
jgi:hypothetical protein